MPTSGHWRGRSSTGNRLLWHSIPRLLALRSKGMMKLVCADRVQFFAIYRPPCVSVTMVLAP